MQILATNAHMLEELVLEATASHPAEQIWLGDEHVSNVHFRPSPADASGAVSEQVWQEQVAGANARTAESVNLAVEADIRAFIPFYFQRPPQIPIGADVEVLVVLLIAEAVINLKAADPSAVLPQIATAKTEHATLWLRIVELAVRDVAHIKVIWADLAPAVAAEAEQIEAGP